MNKTVFFPLALAVMAAPVLAQRTTPTTPARAADAEATYRDIQSTLGSVPAFLRAYPDYAIAGAWQEMKNIQLSPNTALSNKQKELIGLGVAAQIPCDFCVYFHTEVAKANGATDAEIKQAIVTAGLARHWSTILNGVQQDEAAFKAEMSKMVAFMSRQQSAGGSARAPSAPITDAASATRDIEAKMGAVPTFLRALPPEGLPAAWKLFQAIEMNPNGPLDSKTSSLISMAVAAQTPCRYCVIADKEFGKMNGVTERETREAIAVAAIVRHWSTFLNGAQIDEDQFRRDVDRIVANARRGGSGETGSPGTGVKVKVKTK